MRVAEHVDGQELGVRQYDRGWVEAAPGVVEVDELLLIETPELGVAERVERSGLGIGRIGLDERRVMPFYSRCDDRRRRHGWACGPPSQPDTTLEHPKARAERFGASSRLRAIAVCFTAIFRPMLGVKRGRL